MRRTAKSSDILAGVDTNKLLGMTIEEAKAYVKSCPNGNDIDVWICDEDSYQKDKYAANTIRLRVKEGEKTVSAAKKK